MYRLTIFKQFDLTSGAINYRISHKGEVLKEFTEHKFDLYTLYRRLRETMRDLLYAEFRDEYRHKERHHWRDINKSIVSALKRANRL